MKISSLKFKDIAKVISTKSLKLALFDEGTQLFHPVPPSSRRAPKSSRSKIQADKPQTTKHIRPQNTSSQPDYLHHLRASVLQYIGFISLEQKKNMQAQLQIMRQAIIYCKHYTQLVKKMEQVQRQVSKIFSNRLMHLIFYLLLTFFQEASTTRRINVQIRQLQLCEYYSRKFNFKHLTLSLCVHLQHLYILNNDYIQSRQYARKSLKLSVILEDKYIECKMIDELGKLNYYEGRMTACQKGNLLSKEERERIFSLYDEEEEMPNIFSFLQTKKAQIADADKFLPEFQVQSKNNFYQNDIPASNHAYFLQNYHQITKPLREKKSNLRQILARVALVGSVRKYVSNDGSYITLRPKQYQMRDKNQGQVMLTHKKREDKGRVKQIMNNGVARVRQMLQSCIMIIQFSVDK